MESVTFDPLTAGFVCPYEPAGDVTETLESPRIDAVALSPRPEKGGRHLAGRKDHFGAGPYTVEITEHVTTIQVHQNREH